MNTSLPTSDAQQTGRWHYERGRMLYQAGQYRKAATAFRKAIRRAPGMPLPYVGRGLSLVRLNRYQRAVRNIERAMALAAESGHFEEAPWLAQAAYEGARTYERLEQFYMALRLYTKAIESAPKDASPESLAEIYRHRGRVHLRLKHYDPALSDLNRSIEADPGNAVTYLSRSATHEKLAQPAEAIADLRTFLEVADAKDPHRDQAETQLAILIDTHG